MRDKYAKILELSEGDKTKMSYHDAYNYADFVYSSLFENLTLNTELTE